MYTYVSAFRSVCLELGNLVTDDAKLFRFISGLKQDVQQNILLDTNVTTLSDAILLAERVPQTQDFRKYGTTYKNQPKPPRNHTVPMELGIMSRSNNF